MPSERSPITVGTRVVLSESWRPGVVTAKDLSNGWVNIAYDDGWHTNAPSEKYMPEADLVALIRGIFARNPEANRTAPTPQAGGRNEG